MIHMGSTVCWRGEPALTGEVIDISLWRTSIKVRVLSVPQGNTLQVGFEDWFRLGDWRERQQD